MVALADIRVGDYVRLEDGAQGCVVFNSVSGEYSDDFTEADWGYLDEAGLMVMTTDAGLCFYASSTIDPRDIALVSSPARTLAILARVQVGDWVLVENAVEGRVVINAYSCDCADAFPKADWSQDDISGLMIQQENGALINCPLWAFSDAGDALEMLRPVKQAGARGD